MKLRKKHDQSFLASFAESSRLIYLPYACELIPQPCCLVDVAQCQLYDYSGSVEKKHFQATSCKIN
ncbi:hypothetical protein T4D_11469 [Trichinella pseudospiralis]|uniref:Uncharacterized protein n=1 Tax=Trichinella pseudospiralis TaxID=6337 RepID=A0A0V1G3Y2_TRIPS|nr:hypothetical protein T4D_11469 [Trichinella pseudospiralis]